MALAAACAFAGTTGGVLGVGGWLLRGALGVLLAFAVVRVVASADGASGGGALGGGVSGGTASWIGAAAGGDGSTGSGACTVGGFATAWVGWGTTTTGFGVSSSSSSSDGAADAALAAAKVTFSLSLLARCLTRKSGHTQRP